MVCTFKISLTNNERQHHGVSSTYIGIWIDQETTEEGTGKEERAQQKRWFYGGVFENNRQKGPRQ